MTKPNIVHIFAESMSYYDIAALGNDEVLTPNLDRLVAKGTTMIEAHNQGSFSGAVCVPSRGMLYTGRYLFGLNGSGGNVPSDHTLLGEYLGQHGYDTFHTGKWHMSRDSYRRSYQNGATIHCWAKGWYKECNGHWHDPIHDFDPTGEFTAEDGRLASPLIPFEPPFTITEPGEDCVHSVELFTNSAIEFLETRADKPKPFFLDIPHITVHDPLQAPQRILDLYKDRSVSLYPNHAEHHYCDNGDLHVRDECLMPWPRTEQAVLRRRLELYATITHLDEQVGRIMDTLDELGLSENTIIIFDADHGCAHGQHGLVGKQNCYDHSIRVPLVMAGPGIVAGQINHGLCYLSDLFPTLCDLAELPIPASVQGRSFVNNLSGRESVANDMLYLAYLDKQRAVRDKRYKLIEYVVDGYRTRQLFDVIRDPWETQNLIDDPACSNHGESLLEALEELHTKYQDEQTAHGERYWSARREAQHGLVEFTPLPPEKVTDHMRDLWRQIDEYQYEVNRRS